MQDTYSNMAAIEKFIRDGSISVVCMSDVVVDNIEQVDGYE